MKKSNPKSQNAPPPPKKPLTTFLKWSGDNREIFKKKNPEMKQKELLTVLGEEWGKVAENIKKKYQDAYEKEKKKFDEELKVYVEKYGAPAPLKKKNKEKDMEEVDKKGKKTKKEKAKESAKK